MKKLFITCAASLGGAMGACAQGAINLDTRMLDYAVAVDAPGNYYYGSLRRRDWESEPNEGSARHQWLWRAPL